MPPAVAGPGGLVTVIWVAESAVIVPAAAPNRTTVAPASPVPVILTVLPPTVLPPAGDTPVTTGSGTGGEGRVRPMAATVPAPATATAMAAAMVFLTAPACRTRERRCRWRRRIFSSVLPWTAGRLADGHRAASSSAASPRCDRPRWYQRGP